jgi:hypothetical protein
MNTNWTKKITAQILAVSQETDDAAKAFTEWQFSGSITDHGKPVARCGLCGHAGLRYHFMIANRHTGEALWVGSQCILNFDISIPQTSGRKLLSPKEKQIELKGYVDNTKITKLLIPLQQLYQQVGKADRRKVHWAVGKFQRRGAFSPKDLAWLFQAMRLVGINYQAGDYSLTLRAKQDRLEYTQLSLTARAMIEPCLTDKQREQLNP